MHEKLVITGMGAVTPIGCSVTEYWDNLIAGNCGIGPITQFDSDDLAVHIAAEVKNFNIGSYMPKKLINETDAFTQYAFVAANEALKDGLPAEPDRTGIVMGTAMAGVSTTAATQEILTNAVHKNVGPRFVPRVLANIAATQIAIQHGISGTSVTLSTACASGGDAISAAAMLILAGEADAVLAVGAESLLCPLVIYSLANAHTLSRDNDDPLHACRPFDISRNGFVIGEGGGAVVIETETHAKARGAKIYAELAGWANNNDAYHVMNPVPDGSTSGVCLQRALKRARITADQVDYINAHGTGTKTGDKAEIAALQKVFGECSPMISSTKAATGHMMGGGGITEAIACIQAIRTGIVPPTLNLKNPEVEFDFVTGESRSGQKIDIAMTNAFGFGGQNSSLIFRRSE